MKKRTVPEFAVDMVRDDGSVSGCGNRKKFFRARGNSNKKIKGNSKRSGDAPEVKEMWDTIVGGDSEEEKKGIKKELDDDYFIDDSGVDPVNRHGSNHCGYSSSQAEEGEEDDEIKDLFKTGKKKKKTEKTAMEIAIVVEKIMAELEVAAEEDANLNRASKPAINKLIKLPFLIEALSKKQLQPEFLDHGVLTLLKNWLEPLPDGSLPNRNIRTAILEILTEFPIDLYQDDRREQLKKSGIGKVGLIIVSKLVVMFMSKSDEETASNRKLAKDLVDKWSRQIFHISNRFEDLKDERIPIRRPSIKMPTNKSSGMQFRDDDDLDPAKYSQEPKSGNSTSTLHASRPGTMPLHFVVRPQSKIDPDEVKARAKQAMQEYQRRVKMNKRLRQLKKKKQLQAIKLSVEGRGMIKYV
ncbi:putative transcription regulator IWS1 family [Helianthus annuus]|nr:putative transcription regulator IWS1 family [Helianthus annuus]